MSTITLPNIRVSSDLTVKVRLKDNGVAIDWSTLSNIKACIYSDAQRALAGRCDVSVDAEDPTVLVCQYAANKPQYVGVCRIVVSAKYMGETKTYDKPAFSFVRWTADQEGEEITIDDPDVDVEISVEDISSSILQEAVDAAFTAADRANEAAAAAEHMVDIHTGPKGDKGDTGETPDISIGTVTTVEPGTPASASMSGTPEAPVLNLSIPKGAVGSTPNISIGTVTTGAPGTPVVITITGTAEAPVLNVTIPQGMKGDTGVSADYPITIYNGLDSDATDAALSAAQGKVLDGKISQLRQKLIKLTGFGINGTAAGVTTLGDIYYNTNTKLLRKWITGSTPETGTYETVPYYDGAVYTCGGHLYVWNGDNLVSKEEELGKKLKDYETIVESANVHSSATPAPSSASNPTDGEDWDGHLVQSNNGQIAANANYRASYFIPVVGGTAYKSNTELRTVAFYTAEKNFIALSGRENVAANTQITAPSGASFIRFSYVVYQGSPSTSSVKFGKYDQEINVDFQRIVKIDNFVLDGNNIEDSAVTNEKIKDGTITNEKMKFPLPIVLSNNLFDKNTMVDDNHYIGNSGNYASASGWSCTIPIEIEPNTDYYFYASSWGRTTGYVWYNDNMLPIDGSTTGVDTIAGVHRSPLSAKYVRFNLKSGGVDSTNVMLAKSSQAIPYVDYGQAKLPTSGIDNFENEVRRVAGVKLTKLNVTKDGLSLTIGCGNDYVKFNLENTGNPVCNIVKRMFNNIENNAMDDIAPMHILGTTLGANHAQPIQKATITAHGLTNADIGTEWVNGNAVKFYPVKIVDGDNILFLSENTRTYLDPVRVKLAQGNTLTRNGNVLTVESVTDTQMWPGVKNHIVNVYCDDSAISQDGTFQCDKCIVSEQYEIMNPESVLQNLIESTGNPDAPVYDGNSAVSVANLYVFDGSITMGVINTVTFLEAIRFADIMSTQLTKLPGGSISFYVPNSTLIAEGVDLRTPTVVNWSSNIPLCYITQDKAFNPEYPVNRILQYGNNIGYAIGYITDLAVSRKLNKYTTQYFEIRNNTGKIYPHPVNEAKTSSYQSVGNTYTSVMYVAPFVPESQNNGRMNLYTVKVEGCVYVFVDYRSSILDKVVIDNAFNGKEITVLESSNAELVVMDNNNGDEITNNIYNNGFYVKATYVEGETCYLVAKIK